MSAPLFVVHVRKYRRAMPGVLGPETVAHRAEGVGVGTCRVCGRTVVRGKGRWWE